MKFILLPGNPPSRFYYELWIKELSEFDPLNPTKAGIAFPVGLSLNEIAAHIQAKYDLKFERIHKCFSNLNDSSFLKNIV